MSRLASRRGPASASGAYVPTRSEIEAQTAEFKQRKLEALANLPDPAETERQSNREKLRKRRRAEIEAAEAKIEERRRLSFESAADAQPMSREDICNVEFIDSRDLDRVFDDLIEAASFQHALEDCECRWNIADVDPDMMDLSDPPPFKGQKPFKPSGAFGVVG
jgi:hypothetical protein